MTTKEIVGLARTVLLNPQGWSLEYFTPWKGKHLVFAYNPEKQSGETGLPIYIVVDGQSARFATADETLEIMGLSIAEVNEDTENPDEIVEILE